MFAMTGAVSGTVPPATGTEPLQAASLAVLEAVQVVVALVAPTGPV